MPRAALPPHEIADLALAPVGEAQIAWAAQQMPVLSAVSERFERQQPLSGIRIAACLHVTAETANLLGTLIAGGASTALCSANPLSTQDDVAAALVFAHGVEVRAIRGENLPTYAAHVHALLRGDPQVTIDDGADLLVTAHESGDYSLEGVIGGIEETTTGLVPAATDRRPGHVGLSGAGGQRSADGACAQRSTTARVSPRSTELCALGTCCSPGARLSSSATDGPDRESLSAPAALAPP